ncbi:MAG: 6-carboxytetrahydropterin synthase QueD [Verrucomicrobiota bacterium]|nr:6-carboxytetrahydropterin synthase QueD [Verrucomicrobiota bacterium]
MKVELKKSFQFEAAHSLPHLPAEHKCARLHGHSFKIELTVEGHVDKKLGWLIDYGDLSEAFRPTWEKLDHHHLNEIEGLENPTSENIARWTWDEIKPKIPLLTTIEIAETCNASCIYRGQ